MSNKVRFMHFRRINNGKIESRGGATIAYKTDANGNVTVSSFARCSDNDNYSRQRGREVAVGRLHDPIMARKHEAVGETQFREAMDAKLSQSLNVRRKHHTRRAADRTG